MLESLTTEFAQTLKQPLKPQERLRGCILVLKSFAKDAGKLGKFHSTSLATEEASDCVDARYRWRQAGYAYSHSHRQSQKTVITCSTAT